MKIKHFIARCHNGNPHSRRACAIADWSVLREAYRAYAGNRCDALLQLTVIPRECPILIAVQPGRHREHEEMITFKSQWNAFEFLQSAQEESRANEQHQRERNLRGHQGSCKPRSSRPEPAPRPALF